MTEPSSTTPFVANPDELIRAYDDLPLWSAPFGLALLDAVRLRGVRTALDLGCGLGFPTIELAARLGSRARVVGLDVWEDGLRRSNEKARARQVTNVEFVAGSALAMPFADETFDLVVSNNGINNVADQPKALSECYRVSRKGAQLVVTVNLPDTMKEFYSIYRAVLRDRGDTAAIERLEAHIWEKRRPREVLLQSIERAGVSVTSAKEQEFSLRFASAEALFEHWFMRWGFVEPWVKVLSEGEVEATFAEIRCRLDRIAFEEGGLSLSVPYVCIDARK